MTLQASTADNRQEASTAGNRLQTHTVLYIIVVLPKFAYVKGL